MIGVELFDAVTDNADEKRFFDQCVIQAFNRDPTNPGKFPSSFIGRRQENSYAIKIFLKDCGFTHSQTTKQPHIRILTPHDVDEDGLLLATKEFKAACAKQNRRITLFVKREDSLAFSSEERFGRNVTIRAQFKCKKQSERAAKDQAYFTWGSGSDSKTTTFQAKPESLSLASPSRILTHPIFQGKPESALAGHVIC